MCVMSPAVLSNTTAMATLTTTATTTAAAAAAAVEMPSAWSALVAMLPTYWWVPLSCAVFLLSAVHHTCQCWQLNCDRRRLRCCNAQLRAARVTNPHALPGSTHRNSNATSNTSNDGSTSTAAADKIALLASADDVLRRLSTPAHEEGEQQPVHQQQRRRSSICVALGATSEPEVITTTTKSSPWGTSPMTGPEAPTQPPSTTLTPDTGHEESKATWDERTNAAHNEEENLTATTSTSNNIAGGKAELRQTRLTINTNLVPTAAPLHVSQNDSCGEVSERRGEGGGQQGVRNVNEDINNGVECAAVGAEHGLRVRLRDSLSAMPSHDNSRILSPGGVMGGNGSGTGSRLGSFGGACPLPESLKDEQRTIHLHVQKNAEACLEARRALESIKQTSSTYEKD